MAEAQASHAAAHLALDRRTIAPDTGRDDAQRDKVLVLHQLGGRVRAERVDEQRRGLAKLADREVVQRAVHLEPVAPVPVAALVNESVRGRIGAQQVKRRLRSRPRHTHLFA